MSSDSFKNVIYKMCLRFIYSIDMYKQNLAFNKLEDLINHKIQRNQTERNQPLHQLIFKRT